MFLPFILDHFGVANTEAAGEVNDSVRYAFFFGAVVLLAAITGTVVSTREYTPAVLAGFDVAVPPEVQAAAAING
ncbi:MFS transporter, partial [Stenotrophomonas maltophilia]